MKKFVFLLLTAVFSLGVHADDGPRKQDAEKYCARMKDGMMRVMHQNEPITTTILLADGTQIKTDGTVIKKDGTLYVLKEGECVDKDGKIGDSPAKKK